MWPRLFCSVNWNLLDDPHKKLAHQLSNLRMVTLKSKVTAGNEVYLSIGQVAFEGIGCCFLYFSQNTHFSIPRYIVILWYGFASFIASLVPKVLLMIVSTYLVTSVS